MRYLQHADTSARLLGVRAWSRGLGVLRSRARSGISLLEVVFSIGVVMIGLVGIAALIPVARTQARKGAVAAGAANLGQSAARDFHVRGMAYPGNWRWFNGGPNFVKVPADSRDDYTPMPGESFCLDARFVGGPVPPADSIARAKFPMNWSYDSGLLFMHRVSLAGPLGAMDPLQAEQTFLGRDDLVFDLPSDRTRGPVQNLRSQPQPQCGVTWTAVFRGWRQSCQNLID